MQQYRQFIQDLPRHHTHLEQNIPLRSVYTQHSHQPQLTGISHLLPLGPQLPGIHHHLHCQPRQHIHLELSDYDRLEHMASQPEKGGKWSYHQ